jgi:predicted transcriptional regulator
VRTTIYLDDDLNERIRRLVPSRGLNRFINEAVAEKVQAVENERVRVAMREGYLASAEERTDLESDWAPVELEDWPA